MILEYNGLCLDTCAVGMQCMLHKEKHETNFAVYIAAVIISKKYSTLIISDGSFLMMVWKKN